ncbi:MAG: glutamate--tRNA ligase [Bacteroidota bacterium]
MNNFRVRFAPSPTGALHIGGVRTALYNFLLARQLGGTFILRIEDTDQTRYVPGAEAYIIEALEWCGMVPDEGPGFGGDYGPYRQSERKAMYAQFAAVLIDKGRAYYAFDSDESLQKLRAQYESDGKTFRYDASVRDSLDNSLGMSADQIAARLASGEPYTIRLKVPTGETVTVSDLIRGEVTFSTDELDDKIMLKSDGMPTYHLANIVDDHAMKISHVIRGEEWLPSTAHHVLLYQAFGWEGEMPKFAHLPLIYKPTGKGKLSKRDGTKLGIPVFPLSWKGETPEDSFEGFREFGFLPEAMLNFLAFLGWNPGTEQEIFSLQQLIEAFSIERIGKSGARFDFDKAKWFNQQYLIATPNDELAKLVRPHLEVQGVEASESELQTFCGMMKERVVVLPEFWDQGYYFFAPIRSYEEKMIRKRWKPERRATFEELKENLLGLSAFDGASIESCVKAFMEKHELKFGDVLPILRIALAGTMKGPSIFEIAAFLGVERVGKRLQEGYDHFDKVKEGVA